MVPSKRVPWCSAIQHWLAHEWTSIAFVVTLVVVLHHAGPLKPLSRLTLLVLAHLHADPSDAAVIATPRAPVWLVYIDQADFERRFEERRPFSRCRVHDDLQAILRKQPRVLAIDLDLSPVAKVVKGDEDCQQRLDSLLRQRDGLVRSTRIVLIEPFRPGTPELAEAKTVWKRDFIPSSSVSFASAEMVFPFNMAIEFTCDDVGLAEVAYWAAHARDPKICGEHGHSHPLNYRAYRERVFERRAAELGDPAIGAETVVFYGSRAGPADRALTPIGEMHGVVAHAAKFVSLEPGLRESGWLNLLFDLAFALVFSAFVSWFVYRYLSCVDTPLGRARRATWMLGFGVGYLVMVGGAVALAYWAIRHVGLITEPLLIALGLAIDAFIIAGWEHVGSHSDSDEPRDCLRAREIGLAIITRACTRWHELLSVWGERPLYGTVVGLRTFLFWTVVVAALWFTWRME